MKVSARPLAFSLLPLGLLLASPAWSRETAPRPSAASAEQRFTLLEGGRNFRDVGGYRTADGHMVKRGVMYRSGSMGSLTVKGQQQLASLRIGSIIDLRSNEERARDTNNWLAASGQGYWARNYGMSTGDLARVFGNPANLNAGYVRNMMAQGYRTTAREQAPAYRQMFTRLITDKGPLVVNCTAGKDRTGVATALVLTALGVPYATVRADYLLSNNAPGMESLQGSLSGPLTRLPRDVVQPLIGVEGEYLDTAFDQLRKDYGSVESYLQKELGVGPREIALLRRRMLIR